MYDISSSLATFFCHGGCMCVPNRAKVHKCPLPGPIYTTKEDVSSLELKPGSRERGHGKLPNTLGRELGVVWCVLLIGRPLCRGGVPGCIIEGRCSTRVAGCCRNVSCLVWHNHGIFPFRVRWQSVSRADARYPEWAMSPDSYVYCHST